MNSNKIEEQVRRFGLHGRLRKEFEGHLNYYDRANVYKTDFCKHNTDDCLNSKKYGSEASTHSLAYVKSMGQLGRMAEEEENNQKQGELCLTSNKNEQQNIDEQFFGVDPVQHPFLYEYLHPKPVQPEKSRSKLKDSVKRYTEFRRKSLEKGQTQRSPEPLISRQSNLHRLANMLQQVLSQNSDQKEFSPAKYKNQQLLITKATIETEQLREIQMLKYKIPDKIKPYDSETTYLEWLSKRTKNQSQTRNSLFNSQKKRFTHNFKRPSAKRRHSPPTQDTSKLTPWQMTLFRLNTKLIKSVLRRRSPDFQPITERASEQSTSTLFKACQQR